MAEYIERKALREAFDNADADVVEEYEDGGSEWGFGRQNILDVINSVPAADVAPVRHGRWDSIPNTYICVAGKAGSYHGNATSCSACNEINPNAYKTNYCPNCGAKMDGDGNG